MSCPLHSSDWSCAGCAKNQTIRKSNELNNIIDEHKAYIARLEDTIRALQHEEYSISPRESNKYLRDIESGLEDGNNKRSIEECLKEEVR